MLSFEALHAGCTRRNAETLLTQFYLTRISVFGDKKATQGFTKPLQEEAKTDLKPEGACDAAAFLQRFGGGI